MIESLKGQSLKQRVARPSDKIRYMLKQVVRKHQELYPPCEWSLDTRSVAEVFEHYIMAANDKSIGWTGFLYPGTRANIQKSVEKRSMIVRLAKFGMALRFSWANSLHAMSPKQAVMEGLRDPALAFIKGEGHPPRKLQTKTWRLIWCLSEVDRVIDAAIFTEQDKMDTLSYQGGSRTKHGKVTEPLTRPMELAVGVGHDDASLERIFHELASIVEKYFRATSENKKSVDPKKIHHIHLNLSR